MVDRRALLYGKRPPAFRPGDPQLRRRVGKIARPRNVSKAFAAFIDKAKLTKISLHSLRHTHITELLRAGIHPKVVSERAGHSSVAFSLQRHAHALPDMQQDAADQAQKLVGALVTK